jgi:hypothetical protein
MKRRGMCSGAFSLVWEMYFSILWVKKSVAANAQVFFLKVTSTTPRTVHRQGLPRGKTEAQLDMKKP